MHITLAAISDSPYRSAVEEFTERIAVLLEGRARLANLTVGQPREHETGTGLRAEEEGLRDRAAEKAAHGFCRTDGACPVPVESLWVAGDLHGALVRELAHCDLGVVGKTLTGELTGGRGLGAEVARLKQWCTRPLAIVPERVHPIGKVLFVYTEHPEAGHALSLAAPLARKGVAVYLLQAISPLGRTELVGTGARYLELHDVPFEMADVECENCEATGGPAGEVLHFAAQEQLDLIVMGGTRRGLIGRLLWPEMAQEIAWNTTVPVLIWY